MGVVIGANAESPNLYSPKRLSSQNFVPPILPAIRYPGTLSSLLMVHKTEIVVFHVSCSFAIMVYLTRSHSIDVVLAIYFVTRRWKVVALDCTINIIIFMYLVHFS